MARVYSPLWPACWVDGPDRSRRSPSAAVQNIWDAYIQELSFVPKGGEGAIIDSLPTPLMWTHRGRACHTAGGPAISSHSSYVGRDHLSLRTERLGGRCEDRIYRMDHADEFNVTNSGFFVDSSLAPVLRFRRKSCRSVMSSKALRLKG